MDAKLRHARLADARLYLICGLRPKGRPLEAMLREALAGGVDVFQLRDKTAADDELLAGAAVARRVCDDADALFVLNDRPDLALAAGADGVHVGQDDPPVEQARAVVGAGVLVGQSTHSPAQVDASSADLIGTGPVFPTPTKRWRPAVGVELVRHAAAHFDRPAFAIGGLDVSNLAAVLEAGARRIAVVRAIAEAPDPRDAAYRLRSMLLAAEADGPAPQA